VPISNSGALAPDGTLYLEGGDGYLYALAHLRRQHEVGDSISTAPPPTPVPAIAPDGTVYQGSEQELDADQSRPGTLKWVFAGDNDIYTVPAIDGAGNVYFAVLNTGKPFWVSAAGKLRWTYGGGEFGVQFFSRPSSRRRGNCLDFPGGYDSQLDAVDTTSGTGPLGSIRWLGDEVRASSPAGGRRRDPSPSAGQRRAPLRHRPGRHPESHLRHGPSGSL
jgi:outer membrane protein assembly factor BamB